MKQEIEIEFKNMLNKDEFHHLCQAFNITAAGFKKQTNYYFDTETFELRKKQTALRIREKKDQFVLTLKQPHPKGILETHQSLTNQEAKQMIESGQLPTGDVSLLLVENNLITQPLKSLGALLTYRAQFPYLNGELFLDHSLYLGIEDFELEYEAKERHEGKNTFTQLLNQFGIPERSTLNKIVRFYKYKMGDLS
ncbi:CYTH domain-containing protein [Terrilactibacillus sp. BCM23-1]|uniref:CYTH domain-containing protein n=1 Tax=Terrilactibacillus tamarindi TaxID=2599694 RepID=A0A6N8CLE8_9BACI|nr:CYTH domain-containing protein [Terrilactibacillus tamarindi]MTT30581.1 CYTH domain-containing protein [Terrilactibacillus tamarindi]